MEQAAETLKDKNWALMDVEYIQISSTHQCIRKMYLLMKDGLTDLELNFHPCMRYQDLGPRYQRSFRFCRKHIHKLTYDPMEWPRIRCAEAVSKINEFLVYNDVEMILYKGGTIEKDLCEELCIKSMNIELLPEIKKVESHDPRLEVNWYHGQILRNFHQEAL